MKTARTLGLALVLGCLAALRWNGSTRLGHRLNAIGLALSMVYMLWAFGVGESPISVAGYDDGALTHTIRRVGAESCQAADRSSNRSLRTAPSASRSWRWKVTGSPVKLPTAMLCTSPPPS